MIKKWIFIVLTGALLAACTPDQTSTPSPPSPTQNMVADTWEGLPIFPDSVKTESNIASYRYAVENADIDTVQRFYKDEMQVAGWELLGAADMSGADIGQAYALWFVKDKDIISIDVFTRENIVQVMITLSN